jgi:hypothetical protein
MESPDAPLRFRVHAAPIARFGGHVFGGIALFILIALGAVILGWLIDLLSTVKFSLWGLKLGVDPFVIRILYGVKLFILSVDVVLLVTFIGTSGWLLWKEIVGWARY